MKREILISATPREGRVAILEDDTLVELMVDRADRERIVGDVYHGRVEAVLPGIQAAFVDIGTGKAAFLHASDASRDDAADESDDDGDQSSQRRHPPIQEVIQKGQKLLVQVTKEPIGTKGPRCTTQVSLPGRFLVYMPFSDHVGVSRKIEDREERSRLRSLASEILKKGDGGLIIRTVGEELTREVFERELKTLTGAWKKMQKKARKSSPPALVHREAKLTSGIIRDVFSEHVDALIIDNEDVYEEVRDYLGGVDPDLLDRVRHYGGATALFDEYGVEEAIREAFQRKVELPSGGHIIIEPTEALVSIDVNTGRYTGKKDPEKTILRTNLDAAREVARQLRLRDVGGIIVVDFIDMEVKANQERLLQELRTYLNRDRARTRTLQVSELGLVEMTRQRVRPSLYQSLTDPCVHCGGSGRVFTPDTVVRRIERAVHRAGVEDGKKPLTIRVHPQVALHVLEEEPNFLRRLGKTHGVELDIRDDPLMRQDEFRLLEAPADTDVTARYALS